MADGARAVRIRRGEDLATEPGPSLAPTRRSSPEGRHPNSAGGARGLRMFLLFLIGMSAIYALFMGFAVTSVTSGANTDVELALTVSAAIALVVGWWVTLGQAPTVAYIEGTMLVVRSRLGRSQRFPLDGLRVTLLRTNPSSLLGRDPTEFVEISGRRGPRRTYLVGEHFFDFAH